MITAKFLPYDFGALQREPLLVPGLYPVISRGDLFERGKI